MASASLTIAPAALLAAGGWMYRMLCLVTLLFAFSCLAGGAQLQRAPGATTERSVKAAFLYKFLAYMEFPAEPGPTLVVGVIGADEVAAELARITAGRNVGNRAIAVRNLREGEPLAGVHLVFVGDDAAQLGPLIRTAEKQGTVTVTEQTNGLQQGSVVNFRVVDDRVRFEVSLPAAERCNVRLSSRLLSVAYHVQKGGQ